MTLVLIQFDKSKFLFKFFGLGTISKLFQFGITENANNANFGSFEKTKPQFELTDMLKNSANLLNLLRDL